MCWYFNRNFLPFLNLFNWFWSHWFYFTTEFLWISYFLKKIITKFTLFAIFWNFLKFRLLSKLKSKDETIECFPYQIVACRHFLDFTISKDSRKSFMKPHEWMSANLFKIDGEPAKAHLNILLSLPYKFIFYTPS